jgi:superkiller protein 3
MVSAAAAAAPVPARAAGTEPESAYEEAAKLADAGDYGAAEAILKPLVAKDRNDYRAMTQLGSICQDKGDNKGALKYFRAAVKAAPDYPQAHLFLGRVYFATRRPDDAVAEFNAFVDIVSRTPPAPGDASGRRTCIGGLHYISEVCAGIKRYDTMKAAIEAILKLDPQDQAAHYNLGVCYYKGEHDRPMAYRSFKAAIGLDPSSSTGKKARYAVEFMRNNPDSRVSPDLSFIDQEYRE